MFESRNHALRALGALFIAVSVSATVPWEAGAQQSAAKSANPSVTTNPHPTPTGNVIANVGPCVDYAEYLEFGTSRMGAQPYLTPAVEEISRKYNSGSEWKELVE